MSIEELTLASKFQKEIYVDESDILLLGGAASSSKTHMGLMKHLRNCHDPHYVGYCIRKNSSTLMKAGGLFMAAVDMYRKYDPKIQVKIKDQKIVFTSGAQIVFSHYDSEKASEMYQGLEISCIFYDEVTHAEEHHLWWLISRLRSKASCKHQIWASCNPDNSSWLLKYAMPYLYQEGHPYAGRPDKELNGKVRYLIRQGNDIIWGDSVEEMKEKYGDKVKPRSFRALFGTIKDNPVARKRNPDYEATLLSLPRVERERLYWGNWFAVPEGSSYYLRSWTPELDSIPDHTKFERIVRTYDFAGELPSESNGFRCDWFASVKMGKLKTGDYIILDVVRTHIRFGEWESFILDQAYKDGHRVEIVIPEDPNAAAKGATRMLVRKIIEAGYRCYSKKAISNKLDRFRLFSAACQNGLVSIVKGCATDLWNKIYHDNSFFYNELELFDGGRKGHDDMCDCCSDAFNSLAAKTRINSNFIGGITSAKSDYRNPLLNIN
jgi:predicted phage terminase large subunit-like protein